MKCFKSSLLIFPTILFAGLLFCPAQLFAQIVQLAWDPSPSDDVAGYKIYYKASNSELPLDGLEALEGPSPIDVGNLTSFTLNDLPEGAVYYFRATAYDSSGYESQLSNLATSKWLPATLAPTMNESVNSSAVLVWSPPPTELNLNFSLLFGTDPNLRTDIKINKGRLKKYPNFMPTQKVDGLTDNSYTTSDLFSGTTYYWQVVATDDNGQQYASVISSFIVE
jgi:hypothetical protein